MNDHPPRNQGIAQLTLIQCYERIVSGALHRRDDRLGDRLTALIGVRQERPNRGVRARTLKIHLNRLECENIALRRAFAELKEKLSNLQAREKSARYLALHDELTGLPNRRFFRERLSQELVQAGQRPSLAVLYLDLDGFKTLNDTQGHETGDSLLRIIAERVSHSVRAEDFVSRLGGDEYACLISGLLNRSRLQELATTLSTTISAPVRIDAGTRMHSVRASIGIAVHPADGTTADALLKAADAAMYVAKRQTLPYVFADQISGELSRSAAI